MTAKASSRSRHVRCAPTSCAPTSGSEIRVVASAAMGRRPLRARQQTSGFGWLASTAVVPNVLPRSIRTGHPKDPVPCLLLGQFAVDSRWVGKRVGTGLVKHALQRCVTAAGLVGGGVLIVNAVDPQAAAFGQRRGFVASTDEPLVLFRSIARDLRINDRNPAFSHSRLRGGTQPLRGKSRPRSIGPEKVSGSGTAARRNALPD